MCETNHILLMNVESSLQFTSWWWETVENEVFSNTVYPLTPAPIRD